MGFLEEFAKFLEEYGVIGLAIAFIIGVAVQDLVSSTVDHLLMPVVELFLPEGNWEEYTTTVAGAELGIGPFLSALIDFVIIALIIFIFVRYVMRKDEVEKI